MNGVSICLEEIALEGLDGITLPTLWKRLNHPTSRLSSSLDDTYKAFLWKSILSSGHIQTFLLDKAREELQDFTEDLKTYPYHCLNDEKTGVRGSCSTFYSRKFVDLSKESCDKVEETYGEHIVLVASQLLRENVLFHSHVDPLVDIPDIAYCLLEWVGRSRRHGRLQSTSITFNGLDGSSNFHHVKVLQDFQMITKQAVKDDDGNKTCVLYLSRFHTDHDRDSLPYKICDLIREVPMSFKDICCHVDQPQESVRSVVWELYGSGHVAFSHASQHPDILSRDWDKDQIFVQACRPFFSIGMDDKEEEEDVEQEEETPSDNKESLVKVHAEIPLLNHIYQFIESKGIKGTTVTECTQHFCLPFFVIRWALSNLESQHKAKVVFQDSGRQRISVYVASKVGKEHHGICDQAPDHVPQALQSTAGNEECFSTKSSTERKSVNIVETSKAKFSFVTEKFQRRRSIVLDYLSQVKVVESYGVLKRLIIAKESENGMTGIIDRRTMIRLLERLRNAGDIQILDIDIEVGGDKHKVTLVCDSTLKEDSSEVLAKVSEVKSSMELKKIDEIEECQIVDNLRPLNSARCSVKSGYVPKMAKCELLHIFLFYLIYELAEPDANLEAWRQKFDWAEHLTPEHSPKSIGKGWFTAVSICMLLPLSLFVRVVGVSFQADILDQCIEDPAMKHMLIKDLPALVRFLTTKSQLLNSVLESMSILAAMKLITPTTKLPFTFAKDIACHLNTAAVLTDTRESLPGYAEVKHPEGGKFQETTFQFSSLSVVQQYWHKTRDICLSTNLNMRVNHSGPATQRKKPTLRDYVTDEKNMNSSIKPPGDALGAAGFDSSLYSHLLRNWAWNADPKKPLPVLVEAAVGDGSSADSDWQHCFTATTVSAQSVLKNSGGRGSKRKLDQPNLRSKKRRRLPKKAVKKGGPSQVSHAEVMREPTLTDTGQGIHENNLRKLDAEVAPEIPAMTLNQKITQASRSSSDVVRHATEISGEDSHARITSNTSSGLNQQLPSKTRPRRKRALKAKKKKKIKRSHWTVKIQDLRDLEATRRKQVDRVTFTPQEQKLLFICTLALRILGKKSTDTGYTDWLWTRDILYKDNFESARTKTAMSISRKYRNMMKNPQTKENLNVCTADCVQEKQFWPFCNLGKACDEATFTELVEMLKKKYSMDSMATEAVCLPPSLREVKKEANLQLRVPQNADKDIRSLRMPVASLADIRQGILRDSIVSSVLLEDEMYDSNITYAFLEQFSEDELFTAVSGLKKKHLIVRKCWRNRQDRSQILTAFSHKLSASGQRVLEAHLPSTMVKEEVSLYHQIRLGTVHSREFVSLGDPEVSMKPQTFTLSADSTLAGHVVCVLSLLSTGQLSVQMKIPENILRFKFADESVELEEEDLGNGHSKGASASERRTEKTGVTNTEAQIYAAGSISSDCSKGTIPKKQATERPQNHVVLQDEATSSSAEPKGSLQGNLVHSRMMCPRGQPPGGNGTDVDLLVKEKGDKQKVGSSKATGVKEQPSNNPSLKKNVSGGGGGSSSYRRTSQQPFLDVLSGIEDHLFGACEKSDNLPVYSVDLQSKSNFKCHFTAAHDSSINKMNYGNSNRGTVRKTFCRQQNHSSHLYNQRKVPARIAGNRMKASTIAVNPCSVELNFLPSTEQEPRQKKRNNVKQLVAQHFQQTSREMPKNIDECVNVCSKEFGYKEEDCQALRTVYQSIECGKEVGLTCSEVDKIFNQHAPASTFCIQGLIDVLTAFNLVCEVGLIESCFVTSAFRKHWCLPIVCKNVEQIRHGADEVPCSTPENIGVHSESLVFTSGETTDDTQVDGEPASARVQASAQVSQRNKSEGGEEGGMSVQQDECLLGGSVQINDHCVEDDAKAAHSTKGQGRSGIIKQSRPISRPWFCMNGKVNRKAYNTLHESVLRYIMRYPGVKEFTIAKHFLNLLHPVAVHDILQTLEDGGCVMKRTFSQKKVTLFSKSALGNKDCPKESKVTYFLAVPGAVFTFLKKILLKL